MLLPYLIDQIGDSKETLRQRIRAILRSLCRIYPASKLFGYLADGLKSKNVRVRFECLEELVYLIKRHGIETSYVSKTFPLVATCIGDRDNGVRQAAINVIIEAHTIIGEDVLRFIGKLGEKETNLLQERLRSSMQTQHPKNPVRTGHHTDPELSNSPVKPIGNVGTEESKNSLLSTSTLDNPVDDILNSRGQISHAEIYVDLLNKVTTTTVTKSTILKTTVSEVQPALSRLRHEQSSERVLFSPSKRYLPEYLIDCIDDVDVSKSIDALKQIESMLHEHKYELFVHHVPKLIQSIAPRLRASFSILHQEHGGQMATRYVKHQLSCLIQLFCSQLLAAKVSKEELKSLMKEVITQLLDNSISQFEPHGPQLAKALNVLMIKVLENADRTDTFW